MRMKSEAPPMFTSRSIRLLLGLALLGSFYITPWPSHQAQGEDNQLAEISSLATGGKFYLDKSSFQPVGGGKLRYNVIGQNGSQDPNNPSQRISLNEIDCATGQLRSPIESWSEDSQGNISSRIPGPQGPVSVSSRTEIHQFLKDACARNLPNVRGNW